MSDIPKLDRATYDAFVKGRKYAAVLFDAPAWDMAYWPVMFELFQRAAKELGDSVALGFVDVDGPAEVEIARSIPVANVPLVAYYRDGQLVAGLIGVNQDVIARVRAVMAGQAIGYKDGHQMPMLSDRSSRQS